MFFGMFTAVVIVAISGISAYAIIELARRLHPIAGWKVKEENVLIGNGST